LRVFDADTGRNAHVLSYPVPRESRGDYIQDIATAAVNGQLIAVTGSADGVVRLWDLTHRTAAARIIGRLGRRRGPVRLLEGHTDTVSSVDAAALDGHPVALSGDRDGVLRRWDLEEAMSPRAADHAAPNSVPGISALAMARLAGEPVVVAVTERKTIEIWDIAGRSRLRTIPLPGHEAHYLAASESQAGPIVMSGQAFGSLRAFDLASGTEVWRAEIGDFELMDVAAAPHSGGGIAVLAYSHHAEATKVWSTEGTGPSFFRRDVRGRALVCLDDTLALVYEEPTNVVGVPYPKLVIWDLIADRELRRLDRTEDDASLSCTTTEIDGRAVMVYGGYHGQIQVRDLHTGEVLWTFSGQRQIRMIGKLAVLAQVRSPILVSAPDDDYTGLVQAWDLRSGSADPLCTIDLGAQVTALATDPSSDLVAIGTAKGFVVLRFRPRASGD
jgi:WD40 repeat protein